MLSLPPAFVLSQDQTLRLNQKSSIRLYLVTLKVDALHSASLLDRDPVPHRPKAQGTRFSKRVRRKTLASPTRPKPGPQDIRRPRFSFFHIRLSKNRGKPLTPLPKRQQSPAPRRAQPHVSPYQVIATVKGAGEPRRRRRCGSYILTTPQHRQPTIPKKIKPTKKSHPNQTDPLGKTHPTTQKTKTKSKL